MKRLATLAIPFLLLASLSCRWTPPETAVRIGEEAIPRSEFDCPKLLPESSAQCQQLLRMKMRRVLFDRMLDQAAVMTDASLSPEEQQQIDDMIERLGSMREQYVSVMRCHAATALRLKGENIEIDSDCTVVEQQAEQMAANLTVGELREVIEDDLAAEMEEGQRANMRAELLLRKIRASLGQEGRTEPEFWREVYLAVQPVFYDVTLRMGPAEVLTGDPEGWQG